MALDLSKPWRDRVLIPGASISIRRKPQPICSDIIYYMVGYPNVFEIIGTVAGLLREGEHPNLARKYRDEAMQMDTYSDVIEFTEQHVCVLYFDSEEEVPR